jgi:ribosomal protein S3
MVGLRIKFKGRVNRWRRTKSIVGTRGILLNYTYKARIEYGSAKSIIRKGALGISIWLAYNPMFKEVFLNAIINYQRYSKTLRWKTLTRYYNKFLMKRVEQDSEKKQSSSEMHTFSWDNHIKIR